jgi:hypothetical protein
VQLNFSFISDNPTVDVCMNMGDALYRSTDSSAAFQASMDALLRFKPQIVEALRHGGETHGIEDIMAGLFAGHYDLFFNRQGAAIFELTKYPRYSIYHAFIVVGDMDAAMSLHPLALARARELGAKKMTMTGRLGWQKVLPRYGWKPWMLTMERSVSEELT